MLGYNLFIVLQDCLYHFQFRRFESVIINQWNGQDVIFRHRSTFLYVNMDRGMVVPGSQGVRHFVRQCAYGVRNGVFLSMYTPTIVARQAWIKFVTSLNQNPRRLKSKLRQVWIKIETGLKQNPRRLELKLRQAQIRIETGLEFFRERLKKKIIEPSPIFSEPLPIFFWAFGDFFLSLRGFCSEPLRILFWACVRNVSGRTHFVTKPHPFYNHAHSAHSVPVPVWPFTRASSGSTFEFGYRHPVICV